MLKRTLLAGAIALGTAAPSFAAAQPSSVWDHNGSVMELVDEGPGFGIYYRDIRSGLTKTMPPGVPRFRGVVNGDRVVGEAFVYTKYCFGKPFPYRVSGYFRDGVLDLRGPAAVVDPNSCTIVGYLANSDNAHVVFRLVERLAPPTPPAWDPGKTLVLRPPPPVVVAPPAPPTPPVVVPPAQQPVVVQPVVVPPVVVQAPAPVIVPAPAPVVVPAQNPPPVVVPPAVATPPRVDPAPPKPLSQNERREDIARQLMEFCREFPGDEACNARTSKDGGV